MSITLSSLYYIFKHSGISKEVLHALTYGDSRVYGDYGVMTWTEDSIYISTILNGRLTKQMRSDLRLSLEEKEYNVISSIENIRI